MAYSNRNVPDHTEDRQWDLRFNVPTDDELANIKVCTKKLFDEGKLSYALIGGVELGDNQYADDFGIRHVHMALIFVNRISKRSILSHLQIKRGLGYYAVPRNRSLPYSGWKEHHTKQRTKVDDTLCILELGELPKDRGDANPTFVKRSDDEKKRKLDEIIVEMKELIENNKDDEAFTKFPRTYLQYGEKLKSMLAQKRDFFKSNGDPHIWLYGAPGTGKSAILQVIYPGYYNKNMDTKFFDRYDQEHNTHVLCQDVDQTVIEKLGVQFFKCICDEAGYPIDQKYKTPQIARLTVLITSNFPLCEVLPEDMPGRSTNLKALMRRFYHCNIYEFLRVVGLKLLSKYEINQLKKEGNTDPRRMFVSYDYTRDCPTGEPLKTAEEFAAIVKEHYFK